MKARFLYFFCILIATFNILGLDIYWNYNVLISLQGSDGSIPVGKSIAWHEKPGLGPCYWLDNGLHFAIWMTKGDDGESSDIFYPGDADYNFKYFSKFNEKADYGVLSTNFDSFFKPERMNEMKFFSGDQLHIRTFYDNPKTGRREIWYCDTTFIDPPPDYGFVVMERMRPIEKADAKIYDCYRESYEKRVIPEEFFFDIELTLDAFDVVAYFDFGIVERGDARLTILDREGKLVRRMFDVEYLPGTYRVKWSGAKLDGFMVVPGVYIARFEHKDKVIDKKILYVD